MFFGIRKFFVMGFALFVTSCSSIEQMDNFSVTQEATTTIAKANLIEQLVGNIDFAGFNDFDFTSNQEFTNRKIPKNHIEWIHAKTLDLAITSASDGQNFDFLNKVEFYVEGENLPKVLLAKIDSIPKSAQVLHLSVNSSLDLKPYAVLPKMTISTTVEGKKPTQDTQIKAILKCDVEAQL